MTPERQFKRAVDEYMHGGPTKANLTKLLESIPGGARVGLVEDEKQCKLTILVHKQHRRRVTPNFIRMIQPLGSWWVVQYAGHEKVKANRCQI